jgi:hypothetical protein
MLDLVKVPLASTEYQARFERPSIGFIGVDRARAVEAVVDALLPFGFRLANSDVVAAGPLADHKVVFRFPDRAITLQFTAEYFLFTKEGSNWATAQEDVGILVAAEQALLGGSSTKVANCLVTIAMHAQLLAKPREEVLASFLPAPFREWRKAISYGNHLRWADGDLLLDFSAVFANSIFLKFSSRFEGHPPAAHLLEQVQGQENSIFQLLGIQEQDHEQR